MSKKRELGQYYTIQNPFIHTLFKEWINLFQYEDIICLEPYAGANNIVKLVKECGYNIKWDCYDINPSKSNSVPEYIIKVNDSIINFPKDYKICITNPPYLGKSSARKRKIDYPWLEDDLYKVCLKLMLENCEYVAAIIPESFITANIHMDRLYGVISLTNKMFEDTNCPVCLALFTPNGSNNNTQIYRNDEYLGTIESLKKYELIEDINGIKYNWVFNDKNGNIGVKTVDNQITNDCNFFYGELINPNDIKISSRAFTRISGLPENINRDEFITKCNNILEKYREQTKDVFLTSFKGVRQDGKYRRRLDFKTIRIILNKSLQWFLNDKI